jgi:NAD(P)-dependent dehydrogenase (short-subunit alcohol dehydrogenase family)
MRHILITGGNAGIGKETALALAKNKDKIIIACRNEAKAAKAVEDIKKASGNNEVYSVTCDLASFSSIKAAAKSYRERFGQLDVLINNAGLITDKLKLTADGFELQIGVNHMGHFLWTNLLIDLLEKSEEPRIINVSSTAHYNGKMYFNTFKGEIPASKYKGMAAYAQSKLANVLFTKELARRYPAICSHCLHPGVVSTEIAQKNAKKLWGIVWSLFSPLMLSAAKGAKTTIYLATSSDVLKTNGKYFDKSKEKEPSALANDAALAKKLWEHSEALTGVALKGEGV